MKKVLMLSLGLTIISLGVVKAQEEGTKKEHKHEKKEGKKHEEKKEEKK